MKSPWIKISISLILLLLVPTLFAAQAISITWSWKASSSDIVGFRYQLDGEKEQLWNYVDVHTTYFASPPLDAQVNHTLYVQQSYDNIHWSPSARYAFDATAYGKSSIAPLLDESKTAVVVVKEPKAQRVKRVKKFALELSALGALKVDNMAFSNHFDSDNTFPDFLTYMLPSVALDFVTKNLVSMGSRLALDLRTGVSYDLYKSSASLEAVHFGSVRALGQLDFAISKRERIELGVGIGVTIPFATLKNGVVEEFSVKSISLLYGPVVHAAMRYYLGENLTLGLVSEWTLLLHGPFQLYELKGAMRFALGWVF